MMYTRIIYLSIYLPTHLPAYLPTYLPTYLSSIMLMSRPSVYRLQQSARAGRRVRQVRPDGRRCYQQAGSLSPSSMPSSSSFLSPSSYPSSSSPSSNCLNRRLHHQGARASLSLSSSPPSQSHVLIGVEPGVWHSEQQDFHPDQCGGPLYYSQHRTSDRPEGT